MSELLREELLRFARELRDKASKPPERIYELLFLTSPEIPHIFLIETLRELFRDISSRSFESMVRRAAERAYIQLHTSWKTSDRCSIPTYPPTEDMKQYVERVVQNLKESKHLS